MCDYMYNFRESHCNSNIVCMHVYTYIVKCCLCLECGSHYACIDLNRCRQELAHQSQQLQLQEEILQTLLIEVLFVWPISSPLYAQYVCGFCFEWLIQFGSKHCALATMV